MAVVLRKTRKNEIQIIRKILIETWLDAYSFVPGEDLYAYLDFAYSEEKIDELINNAENQCIIAEFKNEPAAWMRLHISNTEKKFYISSLYVHPSFQGSGIGKKLFAYAEEEALKKDFDRIWLGVMTQNVQAVEWYIKLGFIFEKEEPFTFGKTEVKHLIGYKIIFADNL